MADMPPNTPTGAVPPVKKETGKVQPKKETVRINLPPKPTAAPTIKLPTLPPGGPTGLPTAAPAAARPAPAAAPAPQRATAAPVAPATPRPAPQRTAAAPTVSGLDQILAIAAAVVGLAAIGTTVWMLMMLNNAIAQ